ncbi:MAG: hypothetical protein OXI22_21940 [Defluviicoccus sp.]|nr:hypothetical protein [Defluviicoccus sp.]MDE0386556.1 hypothetical protein [Defluviicoccus sp.]
MDEVIDNVLKGIAKAQRDYQRWSGYWLRDAPEYFLTTYIAREIASYGQQGYSVTLEDGVRGALDEAGGMGRGRPRDDLRPDGKFDILLWWANGTPRTVIEVKRQASRFRTIQRDVARICSVLDQAETIRNGLVAYCSTIDGEPDELKGLLSDRLEAIEAGTRSYVERRGKGVDLYRRKTTVFRTPAGRRECSIYPQAEAIRGRQSRPRVRETFPVGRRRGARPRPDRRAGGDDGRPRRVAGDAGDPGGGYREPR